MALVFYISYFFVKKSHLANKWMSFSYSNSALEEREFQFVYICSLLSKTPFVRKQNGSKLQSCLGVHNFFQKFVFWKDKGYCVDQQCCPNGNCPETICGWSANGLRNSSHIYMNSKLIAHKFNVYMAGITNDLTKIRRSPQVVSGRFPPGQHCWSTRHTANIVWKSGFIFKLK